MLDTLRLLGEGFAGALTWAHLAWAFGGVTLGTFVGVLPDLAGVSGEVIGAWAFVVAAVVLVLGMIFEGI